MKELPVTCVVIYYHEVALSHRRRFAKQMDNLIRWAKPVRADNTTPFEKGGHYVVVTFDDGFQSVIENAIPELLNRNIPSTLFIPTAYIGRNPKWEVEHGFNIYQEKIMTEKQIKELPLDMVSVGSHSTSHNRLTSLGEIDAKKELFESRRKLETILGCEVTLFSFPYGDFNENLLKVARDAGYKRVFSSLPALCFQNFNEYVTGRISVNPTDWHLEFMLKISGAYSWLPVISSFKKRIGLN